MNIIYFTSTVWSIGGLWALWNLGIRRLLLDNFRDALFEERDRLYRLSQDGRIDCDSDAYRSVELLLNGLIRYAHRFTIAYLFLSHMAAEKARKNNSSETSFSNELQSHIAKVKDESVREELAGIVSRIGLLLPKYVAKSSLLCMFAAAIYVVAARFKPVLAVRRRDKAMNRFEQEAYQAAKMDLYCHGAA